LGTATVIGHSMGSFIAYFADRDHPDRSIVIASIGDCDRSEATLGDR
jgi:pimeloyl-ACP methyl ester carboxylesterase